MRSTSLPKRVTVNDMNKYDLVVFDLDGTLLDTAPGVLAAAEYAIGEMGYPTPDAKVLSTFIGPPIELSFERAVGMTPDEVKRAAAIFRKSYQTDHLMKADPYAGIFELFEGLVARGIKPAVATYKRESYALPLLRHFGFDRYTEILYGSDAEGKLSKRDIIEKCIRDAGVSSPERVLMIGDTVHDAIGAAALGVPFIGVTYGFGFNDPNEIRDTDAVAFVDCATDILNYV